MLRKRNPFSQIGEMALTSSSPRKILTDRNPFRTFSAIPPKPPANEFETSRKLVWMNPRARWLRQMLKEIDEARDNGDVATYNTLTARYTKIANASLLPENEDEDKEIPGEEKVK